MDAESMDNTVSPTPVSASSPTADPVDPVEAVEKPPTLVRLLLRRLSRKWGLVGKADGLKDDDLNLDAAQSDQELQIATAEYVTRGYIRRRHPDEIEAVLATLDEAGLRLIRQNFADQALGMQQFVEAFVRTGSYDAERIVPFIGGVVDLFLEILRSQTERAEPGQAAETVNWAQIMNHFIECPEVAMFTGSEGGLLGNKVASSTAKQPTVQRNNFVDRAKHQSCGIEKIYWNEYVEALVTVEGNESVSFFSPHAPGLDAPLAVLTPQLGSVFFKGDQPLYHVQAAAWDEEMQDMAVVLSNRMLIIWRLRNREKCQFQQKRSLRFDAVRKDVRGADKGIAWDVRIMEVNPQTGQPDRTGPKPEESMSEAAMRIMFGEQRLAEEAATQLDIWWNQYLKCYVTTDVCGHLFLWNLRVLDGAFQTSFLNPKKVLTEHTRLVTSHLELNKNKFTTCSLDRSIILWDHRNLTPEMKLQGSGAHSASVLCQAYLPRFNSLVSVACEKRVFVWTIDSTAYRGMKGKLSGHQANVMRVSAGQRVFFTLDEGYTGILWDGVTLAILQMVSASTIIPRHCTVLPELGTICLAGRRLNFYEGNEVAAEKIGKPLSKEQQAKTKHCANLLEGAAAKYASLAESRACMLSVTEMEVRLHDRSNPAQSRALFNTPEGVIINSFAASDTLSVAVFGTSKGAIHFVKYRSGFTLKTYPGRLGEDWQGKGNTSGGTGASSGEAVGGTGTENADSLQKKGRGRQHAAGAVGEASGRTGSPQGTQGHSPKNASKAQGQAGFVAVSTDFPANTGVDEDCAPAGSPTPATEVTAPRRTSARPDTPLRTGPTAEEAMRGMSKNITCVLFSEEEGRVYVGTAEGQTIVFVCEEGFPALRWTHQPEFPSAVTCLNVGFVQDVGLLSVGTRSGSVHLYNISNFRLAGFLPIARMMFEGDAAVQGAAMRHVQLFDLAADPDLPFTLMTIDMSCRIRLWGLDIHEQSGRLREVKLMLDAGHLREVDCIPLAARPPPRAKKPAKVAKKQPDSAAKEEKGESNVCAAGAAGTPGSPSTPNTAGASGSNAVSPGGKGSEGTKDAGGSVLCDDAEGDGEGAVKLVLERAMSQAAVQISAMCTFKGKVCLPTRALQKQPAEGPTRSDEVQDITDAQAKVLGEEADPKRKPAKEPSLLDKAMFITSMGNSGASKGSPKSTTAANPGNAGSKGNDLAFLYVDEPEADPVPEFSCTDSDGDTDQVVGRRLWKRPKSANAKGALAPAVAEPVDVADASRYLWIADSGGWIWCLDVAGTVEEATNRGVPVSVLLESGMNSVRKQASKQQNFTMRMSVKGKDQGTSGVSPPGQKNDHVLPVLAKPASSIKALPEAIRVVGAWPAHLTAVISLVPVSDPAALVSLDVSKDVRVWSSAGDLWGHFSIRSVEGSLPPVVKWPPPHCLAAQTSLMRSAKGLCRKMGFHTNRADEIKVLEERRREAKRAQAHRLARLKQQEEQQAAAATGCTTAAPSQTEASQAAFAKFVARRMDGVPASADVNGGIDTGASPLGDDANPTLTNPTSDITSAAGSGSPNRRKRRHFTQAQLSEMLRGHAFSSGCQTYKQFMRKVKSEATLAKVPEKTAETNSLGGRRRRLARPASAGSIGEVRKGSPLSVTLPPINA